ncbi:alanine racemase [Caminicella sporogenes DSM 14501]|uniref:Alanine racemase n=1 Tax=Caminicella sporogenes DSM 14501 TaxID=1121266 RepID=A0A1M6QFR5_9FIRM|nr:alanine racemase [Caminicella sporogenes]RKD25327.1 alanine racemase [Caminicella sporogenes]SHK19144.1 alanine racemase [Caminicella sporogenes DSM 14501]
MIKELRPVWVEVNLDNLAHNIREVKKIIKPGVLVTAVLKADAYGHGASYIGQTLLENGADRFAVATLSEAIQLRKKYKDVPILILGYTPNESAEDVIRFNIIQTIYSYKQAKFFSDKAKELGKTVMLHVKIDTGMNRLGFQPSEKSIEEIKKIVNLPNIFIEGIFTHFAVADEEDKEFTYEQVKKFNYVVDELEKEGIKIPIKHVSNSAAIIDLPELNYDMVRAGIMLYGLYPSNEVNKKRVNLKPVMSLKTRVAHVKDVKAGIGISYGLIYKTDKESRIATLPIGYADGFTRMLTGKAQVLVKGNKVPVVGRICMDQCMIDVTGLDVKVGDEIIIFGSDGGDSISVDDIAKKLGTINYEVVCMISKRVPRVYIKDKKIAKKVDYVLNL